MRVAKSNFGDAQNVNPMPLPGARDPVSPSTSVCLNPSSWDAPRARPARRVATTLAFVAALHVAGWLWLEIPRPSTVVEHSPNPRPIAIEVLTAPAAVPRPHSAAASASAKPTDRRQRSRSTRTAQTQRTAPQPLPKQPAAAPVVEREPSPTAAQAGASGRAPEWQHAIDGGGAARFRYGSNAERAAAQAGSARPAEQRVAEDELKRRTARAAKTDCRTAHADMGLLALPMLAYDALGNATCRW